MPRKGSGIHTTADLKLRCIVSEITGCWRWQGAATIDGHPRFWIFDKLKGKNCTVSGPRGAAMLVGQDLYAGWRAWMTCQRKDCVNPLHVTTGTVAQWGAWMALHGRLKNSPKRVHAARKRWEKRLPDHLETARHVRESTEPGVALAAKLNLSPQTISKMRTGKSWPEPRGPFDGLGAR